MAPAQGAIISVWLGAFGSPKPYGAQPGDTWVEAKVICARANGDVYAKKLDGPFTNWVPQKYWRPL